MLVKIRPGAALSGAEAEFLDCLRDLPITCLALIDLHIGGHGTRRVDAVLLTPRGLLVVDVQGFRRRQNGILSIPSDPAQPWKISDTPAEFEQESTVGPALQLEESVFAVRDALEQALRDPGRLCGAVVLVPYRGVVVRPARTMLRPGLDVVVTNATDPTELRIYLEGFAESRDWTAERVLSAAHVLGFEGLVTATELAADGFTERAPAPIEAVIPDLRPKPKPVPGPPSRGQHVGALAVLAIGVVGVIMVGALIAGTWIADSDTPARSTDTAPTSTTETVPPTTRSPGCFPFQTDC